MSVTFTQTRLPVLLCSPKKMTSPLGGTSYFEENFFLAMIACSVLYTKTTRFMFFSNRVEYNLLNNTIYVLNVNAKFLYSPFLITYKEPDQFMYEPGFFGARCGVTLERFCLILS